VFIRGSSFFLFLFLLIVEEWRAYGVTTSGWFALFVSLFKPL